MSKDLQDWLYYTNIWLLRVAKLKKKLCKIYVFYVLIEIVVVKVR